MLFNVVPALAQSSIRSFSIQCEPNIYEVDENFSNNALTREDLVDYLSALASDPKVTIRTITITASTSPDGSYEFNTKLSKQRLETIREEVLAIDGIDESMIVIDNKGVAWDDLKVLISNSEEPYKDAVMKILDKEPRLVPFHSGLHIDQRVYDLMNLNGGKVWAHMKKAYLPQLRVMTVTNISYRQYLDLSDVPEVKDELVAPQKGISPLPAAPVVKPEIKEEFEPKLRFKTNGIGWAMFIGNAAVEFDLGKRWSLSIPAYYSALDYFSREAKFRTLTFQPEIRYWMGKKTNWFVGAHAGIGWYNFALNGDNRIQDSGWKHPALGGGLAGGYRMNLNKVGNLQMEFTLGAGVYRTQYDTFINRHNGPLIGTTERTWFGIDQASVSIIYSLGLKKKNK